MAKRACHSRCGGLHIQCGLRFSWAGAAGLPRSEWRRGAYSYTAVCGEKASARLARPVEGTLYLAGEHADREGRNGTVHGAIASGWTAADAILENTPGSR